MGSIPVLFLAAVLAGVPDDGSLPQAIRTAYEANRTALSSFGTVHFRESDGFLPAGSRATLSDVAGADWTRLSNLDGLYVFDGRSARFDHVFPLRDELARRVQVDKDTWRTPLSSWRALTDGQTTLLDLLGITDDGSARRHNPRLIGGTEQFHETIEFPLQPGNPRPTGPPPDLGQDLARAASNSADWRLTHIREDLLIGSVPVVGLTFSATAEGRRQYWVDLERGAVPLRILDSGTGPGRSALLWDFGDVRSVGRGWLPFRMTLAIIGDLSADERVEGVNLREKRITEADFERRPDRSMFRLEFPEPVPLINVTTKVRHDPRRVWDLAAISPAAAARARPLDMAQPQAAPPALPGARRGRPPWAMPLLAAGAALLALSAALVFRKVVHAR